MKIRDLKKSIIKCNALSKIYIHIRQYENFEQYGVSKISSNPIHLELDVKKHRESTVEINELKNAIERYDDDTSFGFMIIDQRFNIQQMGEFDSAQLDRDGNLNVFGTVPPRPVL
ncbi:hypothetical protein LCGC14_1357020 [marine sediment metagenome]|uniref:Uncharacterized protein n=1 Tax=marine sediment metagenome TaxID=412755 RepID=A0A0F9MPK4_9ZZZZ